MICEALNIRQSTKITLLSLAVARFAFVFLSYEQASLHSMNRYDGTLVRIPIDFGYGEMELHMADIVISTSQTLLIFTAKQLFGTIFTPKKACVIKISPILNYEGA